MIPGTLEDGPTMTSTLRRAGLVRLNVSRRDSFGERFGRLRCEGDFDLVLLLQQLNIGFEGGC